MIEWETDRINLKNDKCKSFLLEKYIHMYLFDEGEVRRVSDIIWSTARPANYQLVTKFIEMIDTDSVKRILLHQISNSSFEPLIYI